MPWKGQNGKLLNSSREIRDNISGACLFLAFCLQFNLIIIQFVNLPLAAHQQEQKEFLQTVMRQKIKFALFIRIMLLVGPCLVYMTSIFIDETNIYVTTTKANDGKLTIVFNASHYYHSKKSCP